MTRPWMGRRHARAAVGVGSRLDQSVAAGVDEIRRRRPVARVIGHSTDHAVLPSLIISATS